MANETEKRKIKGAEQFMFAKYFSVFPYFYYSRSINNGLAIFAIFCSECIYLCNIREKESKENRESEREIQKSRSVCRQMLLFICDASKPIIWLLRAHNVTQM